MAGGTIDRRTLLGAAAIGAAGLPGVAAAEPRAAPARLSLNENNFGPSPRVAPAIRAALGKLGPYVDQAEVDALTAQIASLERVPPEQIVLGEILEPLGAHLAAASGGGRFVYSAPGYTALIDAARPLGGEAVAVPLDANLANDLSALDSAITPRTLAVSLVDPHNPSGTINAASDYEAFVLRAATRTLVVIDEAYIEYDDIDRSAVRYTRVGANVLVFRTLSKAYGLAGLPFGYAIAPLALADKLKQAGLGAARAQNRLTLAAASAALGDQAHLAHVVAETRRGRELLHATLDRLGLRRSQSRASFVFFQSRPPAADVRAELARRDILVGRAFPPLDAWIRISIGTRAETARVIAALSDIYRT